MSAIDLRYGSEDYAVADIPDSRDRHRPHCVANMSWTEQMKESLMNPYNRTVNSYICALGKLLTRINPSYVDLALARLYALSTGHKEHSNDEDDQFCMCCYKKLYAEECGNIRRWVYEAVASKIEAAISCFVDKPRPNRDSPDGYYKTYYAETENMFRNGKFRDDNAPLDFGYTIDLSETTRTYLHELLRDICHENIDLHCPVQRKKLDYRLDALLHNLKLDGKRHVTNYLGEMYAARLERPRPPISETIPVCQITGPVISLFPRMTVDFTQFSEPKEKKEFDQYLQENYCEDLLKIYGKLLMLLSSLRKVKMEGNIRDHKLPIFYEWSEGPMEKDRILEATLKYPAERWIAHIPSYDPEFIITLNNFSEFTYSRKRMEETPHACCSLKYLRACAELFTLL